jgi:tetratricopeptide (TPR) repeat protein
MVFMVLLTLALGTSPKDAKEAERLVKQSIVEYNVGDFEAALTDVTKAYKLRPAPALLFNIGQCHRALHHWEKAEFFYRGYLREKPEASNRDKVQALIEEMQEKQKAEAAAALAPAPALAAAPVAAPTVPLVIVPPPAAPASVSATVPTLATASAASLNEKSAPAAAVQASPPPPKSESHHPSGLAIGFGIATLGATAAAAVGAANLIDFQSYRNGLSPGLIYGPPYTAKANTAKTWQVVTPIAAGVALACLAGTVLTW